MSALLDQVLSWLARGIAVFPVRGKNPALKEWKWLQGSLPSEAQVRRWMIGANGYGIVAGWQGLTILDFDQGSWYRAWLQWARARGGIAQLVAEHSYRVQTRKGLHVYVYSATSGENINLRGRFDLLAKSRYALGAGSVHPSGLRYEALDEDAPIIRIHDVRDILPPFVVDAERALSCDTRPSCLSCQEPAQAAEPASMATWPSIQGAIGYLDWQTRIEQAKLVPIWDVLGLDIAAAKVTSSHHMMCCCPVHHDEHPSLSVDTVKNRVSCLAGCTGARGWDSIDAVKWKYGASFQRAVWLLTQQ